MMTSRLSRFSRFSAALLAAAFVTTAAHAQVTWSGGGADANWGTSGNWSGTSTLTGTFNTAFIFAGSTKTSNTNTLLSGTATSITFNAGAGAFLINTGTLALAGNVTNNSSNLQTLSGLVNGTASQTYSGSSITLSGTLQHNAARTVTNNVSAGQTLTINSFIFSDSSTARTLTLAGSGNTTFGTMTGTNGATTASAWTINNTGTTTVTGLSRWSGNTVPTGATSVLIFSGSGGANNGAASYFLQNGTFILDNTGSGNNNNSRIENTSVLGIGAGSFIYRGSDQASTPSTETIGAVAGGSTSAGNINIYGAGGSITVTFGGSNLATLTGASFTVASGRPSILVNGANLGKNNTDTGSVGKFIITSAPTLVGTTAALTSGINSAAKNTQIVPFLLGEATATTGGLGTATGTANTFLTYNASSGLRPLNPTDEFTNNSIVTGNNTYITAATSAATTDAINSLVINGGNLSIADGATITNSSGAFLFASSNAIAPAGTTGSLSGTNNAELRIMVNNGVSGTISARIAANGSNPVTIGGGGTLNLSGSNSYTGGTNLQFSGSTGTLVLGNNYALSTGTVNAISTNITIQASTDLTGIPNVLNINNGSNNPVNVTMSGNNSMTWGGLIHGNTSRTLTNNIAAGKLLTFSGTTFLQESGTGVGRTLTIAGTGTTVFAGTIVDGGTAGNSGIDVTGTATVLLSASNSFTGGVAVRSGNAVVGVNHPFALGSGTLAFASSGQFDNTSGAPVTTTNQLRMASASSTFLGTGSSSLTMGTIYYSGATRTLTITSGTLGASTLISNSGTQTFRQAGAGTLILSGSADAGVNGMFDQNGTGLLVIGHNNALGSGTFQLSGNGSMQAQSADLTAIPNPVQITTTGSFTFTGANSLTFSGGLTGTSLTNSGSNRTLVNTISAGKALTFSGTTALQESGTGVGRTLTVAGSGNTVFSGPLVNGGTAGNSGLTIAGTGTTTLSAANTYTGTTSVNAGVLRYNTDNAISTGAVTINGGTLDLSTFSDSVGTVTLTSGNLIGSGTLTSTGSFALTSGYINASLAGSVGLTKSGNGTVVLSASNAYTGLTTVSGGVLQLGANQTSATSTITVTSGTFDLNGYTMNLQNVPNQKGIQLGGGAAGTRAFVSTGSGTMVIQTGSNAWISYDGTNNPLGAEVAGNVRILGGAFTGFMADDSTATDEDLTISAVISGSLNTVYSSSPGTVVFTGLNTYDAGGHQVRAGTWVLGTNALIGQPGALGSNSINVVNLGNGSTAQNATLLLREGVTTDRRMFIVTATTSPLGFSRTIGGTFTSGTATFSGGVTFNTNGTVTAATGGTIVVNGNMIDGNSSFQSSGTFSKIGGGTVVLGGNNSFSYPTVISQGILSISSSNNLQNTAGVSIADTARLRYTGATGLFGRNVTVTSGTGTIENTGGGTLTLAGTLNKNGTVLRLTGGAFNVTGLITGATPGTSDLLVDGTSTVTLSSANTYDGPTFVNQASNLIVNIANAIPGNSVVTLGNATTTGTLTLGTFSNAIGGLAFGSGGGMLRMTPSATGATAQLTAATGTLTLTNGTLDLGGSGTSAGYYRLASAQSIAGSFASITGTSAAYQLLTTSTSIDYQQRAVLGAVSVTNPATAIITGGSAAFTYTVANTALSGGADLAFTGAGASNVAGSSTGTAAAAGTSSSVSGLFFTGTTTGSGRTGTFTVNAPNAFGTQTATGTVSVDVYAHAAGSATGATIALADSIVGYTGALSGLTSATISNAAGYRVNLMTTGGTSAGFVNINNVSGIVSGSSALVSAAASLNGSQTVGSNSIGQTFNLTYADDSALAGASNNLASQAITVTGKVLDHATSSLASGTSVLLSTELNLGTWDYSKTAWTSGTNSGLFTIANLASIYGANLTADLSLVSVSGTGNGFTTNLNTYTDIAGGQSRQYSVFVDPASFLTSGTQSWTFTIGMSDKTGMAGATSTNTLSVTAQVIVVPEPGTLAMLAAGAAGVAVALRRRRR